MEWIDRVEFSPDGEILVFGFHTVGDGDDRCDFERLLGGWIFIIQNNWFNFKKGIRVKVGTRQIPYITTHYNLKLLHYENKKEISKVLQYHCQPIVPCMYTPCNFKTN
jgi:hypothetical protein